MFRIVFSEPKRYYLGGVDLTGIITHSEVMVYVDTRRLPARVQKHLDQLEESRIAHARIASMGDES
jgi:hypothetical protein